MRTVWYSLLYAVGKIVSQIYLLGSIFKGNKTCIVACRIRFSISSIVGLTHLHLQFRSVKIDAVFGYIHNKIKFLES